MLGNKNIQPANSLTPKEKEYFIKELIGSNVGLQVMDNASETLISSNFYRVLFPVAVSTSLSSLRRKIKELVFGQLKFLDLQTSMLGQVETIEQIYLQKIFGCSP